MMSTNVEDQILKNIYYTEDASAEEIQAIKSRVSLLDENIILLNEIPKVSPFSIKLVFEEMTAFAKELTNCAYLIDISETAVPNAETRRYINAQFQASLANVKHVSFITGRNFIINTAAKFVMYQTNLKSFSIVKNKKEGIEKIKSILSQYE